MKNVYLVLCILGFVLPYSQFVPWVTANGLNLSLFVQQLFANRIGAFFGMDVMVSAVALLVFSRAESSRLGHDRQMVADSRGSDRRCLFRTAIVSIYARTKAGAECGGENRRRLIFPFLLALRLSARARKMKVVGMRGWPV